MSAVPSHVAYRAVRLWVRLYTSGLPAEIRDARRAEIESDLWEQEWEAGRYDADAVAIGLQVLARWLFGVPADLSWRLQTSVRYPGTAITSDQTWRVRLGGLAFVGIGGFLVATSLGGSVAVLLGYLVTMNQVDPGWVLAILLLDGLTILAGLGLMRERPMVGAGVVAVGALLFGMAWHWTVLGPLLAVALVLLGIVQARRRAKDASSA